MKSLGQCSLRRRLQLMIAVLAVPWALALGYLAWQTQAEARAEVLGRIDGRALAAAADLGLFLDHTEALLARLDARHAAAGAGAPACDPILADMAMLDSHYVNFIRLDAGGWIRCSSLGLRPGPPVSLDALIRTMSRREGHRLLIGEPNLGPVSGRWVVPLVYPLQETEDTPRGYLTVSVALDRLDALRLSAVDGGGGSGGTGGGAFLVTRRGLVLAADAASGVKAATQLDGDWLAAIERTALGLDMNDVPQEGGRLFAARVVPGTDWLAVAQGAPGSAQLLQSGLWTRHAAQAAGALVLLALALWLAVSIHRSLAGGLRRLADTAEALADSGEEYESARQRFADDGQDEFARCARALNRVIEGCATARALARREVTVLRNVLDGIELTVLAHDVAGDVLRYLSARAAVLFGEDIRVLAHAPHRLDELVHAEDRPRRQALAAQLPESGQGLIDFRLHLPGGGVRWLRERTRLVRDPAGAEEMRVSVFVDITSQRELMQNLRESEARYRSLLALSSDGFWEQDAELSFTRIEFPDREKTLIAQKQYLGVRRWEVVTVGLTELQWASHRARLARREPIRNFEYGVVLPGIAEPYWLRVNGEPMFDAAGQFLGYRGVSHNITEERRTQARMRLLSAGVEQSPVSILITDARGVIEYVNPHFCESSGYAPHEVIGQTPRMLTSGETTEDAWQSLWQTIGGGHEWTGEMRNRRKDGSLVWERVRIVPLRSEKGAFTHTMSIAIDITLRKELAERERQQQALLLHHARLAAMGEMAAALAHELNQPLAAIANFSGVALHGLAAPAPDRAGVQEGVREAVQAIHDQALRAGDIVWRVREFSKKREARPEPLDLDALIADVARLSGIATKAREVAYEFRLTPELPRVVADRVQIEQVLLNLIRNGVEAMEDNAADARRLILGSRLHEGGFVEVTVRDAGCGLPERIAADLFTPFFTTKPEGMGMGLAISRSIIEAHGGHLWAAPNTAQDGEGGADERSAPGTTFHFTLPIERQDGA